MQQPLICNYLRKVDNIESILNAMAHILHLEVEPLPMAARVEVGT